MRLLRLYNQYREPYYLYSDGGLRIKISFPALKVFILQHIFFVQNGKYNNEGIYNYNLVFEAVHLK
jgi:hypothetical protein